MVYTVSRLSERQVCAAFRATRSTGSRLERRRSVSNWCSRFLL